MRGSRPLPRPHRPSAALDMTAAYSLGHTTSPSFSASMTAAGESDMATTTTTATSRRRRKRTTTSAAATSPSAATATSASSSSSTRSKRPRPNASATASEEEKKLAQPEEKDDEEKELEAFLFGGTLAPDSIPFGLEDATAAHQSFTTTVTSLTPSSSTLPSVNDVDSLFVIDKEGTPALPLSNPISASAPAPTPPIIDSQASASVWFDPDDLHHRIDISAQPRLRKLRHNPDERSITAHDYQQRLRSAFSSLHHDPSWVKGRTAASSDAPLIDPLASSRGVRRKDTGRLPSGHLDIQTLRDANMQEPAQGVIHAVQWHPTAPILMTGGMDCHLRLFSIDAYRNPVLLSLHLPSLPIHSASFLSSSSTLITTGRRRFFHLTDLATGRTTRVTGVRGRDERSWERCVATPQGEYAALLGDGGYISVVEGRTGQWVGGMKGGASVQAGVFSEDGGELWTVGDDDDVFVWDMRTRRCREKRTHPASLHNTAIALTPPSSIASTPLVAIGNTHGIVSLYPSTPLLTPSPQPLRELTSLTTAIDGLTFNSTGELLATRSRRKIDSLSLFHTESGTVVRNWPTGRTPLHYVTAMDFSPHSGYLAVGNDKGRVLLYRLKHYSGM